MDQAANGKCEKNPRYVYQKNKARQFALPGLAWLEPGFIPSVSGGGGDRMSRAKLVTS